MRCQTRQSDLSDCRNSRFSAAEEVSQLAFRSKHFLTKTVDKEELGKDVEAVRSLTDRQRRQFVSFLSEGENLSLNAHALGEKLHSFLRTSGVSAESFQRARKILLFLRGCVEAGDEAEILLSDLSEVVSLGSPGGEGEYSAYDFIAGSTGAIQKAARRLREDSAVRRALPYLTGVNSTVDARVVLAKEFDPLQDDPETFEPVIESWVLVGIVSLNTDEETSIQFQLDSERLGKLISWFRTLQQQLATASDAMQSAGLRVVGLELEDEKEE